MSDFEFEFAHFVEAEVLEARVADFDGLYTTEDIAATAFYLGVLSTTAFAQVFPLYGDPHYIAHLMANIHAGEWLTELIRSGSIHPDAMRALVLREHEDYLKKLSGHTQPVEDSDVKPMDNDTFSRLWGGHSA